jgi:hypothetical protein
MKQRIYIDTSVIGYNTFEIRTPREILKENEDEN